MKHERLQSIILIANLLTVMRMVGGIIAPHIITFDPEVITQADLYAFLQEPVVTLSIVFAISDFADGFFSRRIAGKPDGEGYGAFLDSIADTSAAVGILTTVFLGMVGTEFLESLDSELKFGITVATQLAFFALMIKALQFRD